MFVISLVGEGRLKSALRKNANDAVELAQSWYQENKDNYEEDGYIAIHQDVKGHEENVLFAEIRFDQSPEEAKLYLILNDEHKNIFSSKFALLTKAFLVSFLEYGLLKLTEYLIEKNKSGRSGY